MNDMYHPPDMVHLVVENMRWHLQYDKVTVSALNRIILISMGPMDMEPLE